MSANPYGRCNDESNRAAPPALTEVVTLESQPTEGSSSSGIHTWHGFCGCNGSNINSNGQASAVIDITGPVEDPVREAKGQIKERMCYFDHIRWSCGYWKWGNFRQQCTKEYRTGETCGLKLVYDTDYLPNQCRICDNVHKKTRRYYKMAADVERWRHEGGRTATIEKTEDDMDELSRQIANLNAEHATRVSSVS
ncbi:hypothetical protein M0657_007678 [Pyricularia oryzae]|nr:hypothetical protein M9X92_007213 [Pyricularia oryzae]KAI7918276.1 hypothetical protein M0657_007678 [Pyricularia oryzae]QBZ57704.1 hypothetical protein PoMZ_02639 [Pyricularia oryzae]